MTASLADRAFQVLARHKVPGVIALALPQARKCEYLRDVVCHLVPSRLVFYDAEWVYKPADLVELLARFAAATDWAWQLEDAKAEFDTGQVQRRATVEFGWNGARIRWTFIQESDWIAQEFIAHIVGFARAE